VPFLFDSTRVTKKEKSLLDFQGVRCGAPTLPRQNVGVFLLPFDNFFWKLRRVNPIISQGTIKKTSFDS
jgi:hypothetical protein